MPALLLKDHFGVHHVEIEDGPGKPLGLSFGVKLRPALVFLRDRRVVEQVARPGLGEVREGLGAIVGT